MLELFGHIRSLPTRTSVMPSKSWSTLRLVVTTAALLGSHCASEQNGVLTFWGEANFRGDMWQFHRNLTGQWCFNDNVGEPSSITWQNQLQTGSFDGKAKIGFYTEKDCKGTVRAWFTTEKDFPTNLALDGIDNRIKSFMLWQTSDQADILVH
ncbi:hypothetical protein BBJ28_00006289 [Nothophytophthora sp. Chile5]|nr:hypothetical protein BBJ28_00006289 [Nothophytophthora sp. Chile5]